MKFFTSMHLPITCIILMSVCFIGCKKDKNSDNELELGKTEVTIKISGSEAQVQNGNKMSLGKSKQQHLKHSELFSLNDEYHVLATLIPQEDITKPEDNVSIRSSGMKAAAVQTPVASGTVYYLAVYRETGEYVTHQQYTYVPNQEPKINVNPGKYIFLTVASGTNTLPTINFNQPLSQINLSITDASVDMMYFKQEMEVQAGAVNNLNIVLRHLFTQVVLTVNTAEIGDVVSIGAASITPNLSVANVSLQDGSLSYPPTATSAAKSFSFTNTTGQTLVSNPIFIFPSNSTAGSVTIGSFQIGTVSKPLTFSNLTLMDGIKYTIDFRLLAAGINIGFETWSSGNLIYDAGQDRYGFTLSDNDYGNYWFYNHLLPKKLGGTNQGPDPVINGASGDPCAQVLPKGIWRLPNEDEVNQLLTHTGPNGVDNPHNVNTWDPARYVDYFDGVGSGTNLGMFFGTQNNPTVARHDHLFFVYAGAYHNENTQGPTIGHEGNYLITGTGGGYREFHLTGASGNIGYGASVGQADQLSAYQIRCVKN